MPAGPPPTTITLMSRKVPRTCLGASRGVCGARLAVGYSNRQVLSTMGRVVRAGKARRLATLPLAPPPQAGCQHDERDQRQNAPIEIVLEQRLSEQHQQRGVSSADEHRPAHVEPEGDAGRAE